MWEPIKGSKQSDRTSFGMSTVRDASPGGAGGPEEVAGRQENVMRAWHEAEQREWRGGDRLAVVGVGYRERARCLAQMAVRRVELFPEMVLGKMMKSIWSAPCMGCLLERLP